MFSLETHIELKPYVKFHQFSANGFERDKRYAYKICRQMDGQTDRQSDSKLCLGYKIRI